MTVASFEIINCLSRAHRDHPEAASRPYDADRDGFVLGEGCGVVVLEEKEHALRRGATAYLEISGFSHTSNAIHMTDLLSDGEDLTRAMSQAVEASGVAPGAIDHVSSHGSSTRQNDTCETSALKLALGERAHEIPVNSAKSMLGHALAAASAMEIVLCALASRRLLRAPHRQLRDARPHLRPRLRAGHRSPLGRRGHPQGRQRLRRAPCGDGPAGRAGRGPVMSIVITGAGAVTPAGDGLEPLWNSAREGTSHLATIDRFDAG